jgi:hypothetical protein
VQLNTSSFGPDAFYFADPKKQATQVVGSWIGVYYWKYPKGGYPFATITHALDSPYGMTVSQRSGGR